MIIGYVFHLFQRNMTIFTYNEITDILKIYFLFRKAKSPNNKFIYLYNINKLLTNASINDT